MQRVALAVWQGDLHSGKGQLSTGSGALAEVQYTFASRFDEAPNTNPEELIAAAHAGCFSMALAAQLSEGGYIADSIETKATVTLDRTGSGWAVTKVHLQVTARIAGIDQAAFEHAANAAKVGCPISRLLNTQITMEPALLRTAA